MEPPEEDQIVIVGAGISGLASALGLHRKGIRTLVLESAPTLRGSGFAFTTWTNAFRALDALGIGHKIRDHHLSIEKLVVTSTVSGKKASELNLRAASSKGGTMEIYCVKRKFLLATLAAELPETTIRYSSKVVSIADEPTGSRRGIKLVHLSDGSVIRAKALIGCDGVNSVVAKYLGLKKPSSSGRSAARGFYETSSEHGFKPEFLQFVGKGFRAGLIPCSKSSLYWFFTWSPGKEEEDTKEVQRFVVSKLKQGNVADEITRVIEESEKSEIVLSQLLYRFPPSLIHASISNGNVCVAGDAFHPMTPDVGQGGCTALEDGVVLARCLSESMDMMKGSEQEYDKIKDAMEKYASARRWRSIDVILTAYIIGFMQQADNPVISFLREHFLTGLLARTLLRVSDFDCGKL